MIVVSMVVSTALWFAIRYYAPAAVAHERLQSAAFDPLQQFETRRLRVGGGAIAVVGAFLLFEAFLFRATRKSP